MLVSVWNYKKLEYILSNKCLCNTNSIYELACNLSFEILKGSQGKCCNCIRIILKIIDMVISLLDSWFGNICWDRFTESVDTALGTQQLLPRTP